MIKESLIRHDTHDQLQAGHSINCLSWSAVIVGALVAIGLGFLLNIFGLAINISAYTTTTEGATTFVVAGFISMVISTMIVLFFSGWVSGYLGRAYCLNPNFGLLYGLVTWCLALLVTIVLSGSIGDFMNGQYTSITSSVSEKFLSRASAEKSQDSIAKDIGAVSNHSHRASNDIETAKNISKTLYLVFLLFFAGAISACYGGYVGIRRKDNT